MSAITNLEPKLVWEQFDAITRVPRPSKKEEQMIEFLMQFGQCLGLETRRDETGNVIIRKPATRGMEGKPNMRPGP